MPTSPNQADSKNAKVDIHIGLCLAGAVSAGAYTAGVLDYLSECLARWELAKSLMPENKKIPRHKVSIDVITGASAGGISGGLFLLQNHTEVRVVKEKGYETDPEWFRTQSIQYGTWVNLTERMEKKNILHQLLDTGDIAEKKPSSFLNSRFIDILTEHLINKRSYNIKHLPPFVAPNIEFLASLTNLNGIKTTIDFNNGISNQRLPKGETPNIYTMRSAKDIGHFQLVAQTDGKVKDPPLGQIPLIIDQSTLNMGVFGDVLKATSAFPVGFAPRKVSRLGKYINKNPLINSEDQSIKDDTIVTNWFVDGGAVNNEPFELAANVLRRRYTPPITQTEDDREANTSAFIEENRDPGPEPLRTVFMIDPFPTEADFKPTDQANLSLNDSVLKLLSALRMQPLVKPKTIDEAKNKDDYSRFMIAPRRKILDDKGNVRKNINGSDAIACGLLGGFGGFTDIAIREHDYLLGRFNCQHFMQKRFGYDTNVISHTPIAKECHDDTRYLVYSKKDEQVFPFIPDLLIVQKTDGNWDIALNKMNYYDGKASNPFAPVYPKYPSFSKEELIEKYALYEPMLSKRLRLVISLALKQYRIPALITSIAFRLYWFFKLKKSLCNYLYKAFYKHKLTKK